MGMNDGLPAGWEMSVDPNTGRQFYINHDTMQTSWTPPVEAPLPDGWEQQRDGEGRIFFVNHATQETQWEDPRLGINGDSNGSYPDLNSGSGMNDNSHLSSTANEWNCPACTFANDNSLDTCTMCQTSKPGSSNTSPNPTISSNDQYDDSIDAATAAAIAAAQAEDSWGDVEAREPWDLEPYMVPDEHSLVCTLCAKPFDWKNRRHHCKCSGTLLCHDCSSRRYKLTYKDAKESEQRVCDLCFDHLGAGDKHCYLRYIGILRDAGTSRCNDHMLALQGIADMIEKLPDAMQETASVEQQASALRTLDVVQRCGGAATLCELLNPNDPPDVQIQSCRIIASVAAAAAYSAFDSQAALSRSSVCSQLSSGSAAMNAMEVMLSKRNSPWKAHMHLTHALYLLGDLYEIQEAVRTARLFIPLCECLLASQEEFQTWTVMAVSRLIDGNTNNVGAMLDANGMQALVLLLSSPNIAIKEHAANAICSGLEVEEKDHSPHAASLASRVRDAMVNFGGATAAVGLLRSDSPTIARSGLKLLRYLSNGQAEVVRAAGAVPLVVALLASQDQDSQSSAAQILRNVALCSGAGSQEVLESGGLSMCIPLLAATTQPKTQANAASLCEAFASDSKGSSIILETGGVQMLIGLVKSHDNIIRAPAAGALVQLLQCGQMEKQAVVNAGGVEALLALENSSDPAVLAQLIGAVYSFVSDQTLLESLTKRIAPPTLAMKLLGMLNGKISLDIPTIEMLLLVVAVLCGARDGDQFRDSPQESSQQEMQTKDLVASNGASLILPLLNSSAQQPALVLAVFRVLLAICSSETGSQRVSKAGGIPKVVRALDDSLNVEGHNSDANHLVNQLRLYGITIFGLLCGGGTVANATSDDIRYGVRAITRVLDSNDDVNSQDKVATQLAAVRALRNLSCHSANWEIIATIALPQLIEMLLASESEPTLLKDIANIIANLAKLEKHSEMILDAGAVFALLGLLSEMEGGAVEAGLDTLCALAESSKRCRSAMVDQGAAPKLLHIAEQRDPPISTNALKCLYCLSQDPANAAKVTSENGATDSLLRLVKSRDFDLGGLALKILLIVAKDSDNLWEQLVVNADIESSVALLRMGPPRVQAQACSTIAALCGDSPGYALCASPTILDIIPLIVQLLMPSEHLGSDKSESPAKEAAAACALLCAAPASRNALMNANVIPALVQLLMRERRLGRPRSATSEHTLNAIFAFSKAIETQQKDNDHNNEEEKEEGKNTQQNNNIWQLVQKTGKRRDAVDAISTILDAHVRDTKPTPSGCERFQICENAIILLGKLPEDGTLSPNEITIFGRSARSLNLVMNEASPPEALINACLDTLDRLGKETSQTSILISSGTIRSVSKLLEPLTLDNEQVDTRNVLKAAALIASLVKHSKDRSVDDAIIGTKTVPALAALLTKTEKYFPTNELCEVALSAGLEAISLLSQGGIAVQKAIMAKENNVLPALSNVLSSFSENDDDQHTGTKRATYALIALGRMAQLDEHRSLIVDSNILQICLQILATDEDEDHHNNNDEQKLIKATLGLLAELGPTIVIATPEIVDPLINVIVLNQENLRKHSHLSLKILATFTIDYSICLKIVEENNSQNVFNTLKTLFNETKDMEIKFHISEIMVHLSNVPNVLSNDDIIEILIDYVSNAIGNGKTHTILSTNGLMVLNNILLTKQAREKSGKSKVLVQAIKIIATSADTEIYSSHLASKAYSFLGLGETLKKKLKPPPPPTNMKQAPPPPMPNNSNNNNNMMMKQQPPPKLPSSSPLLNAKPSPIPPPPLPDNNTTTKAPLLPTYSGTVGSSSLRSKPNGNGVDQASLDLVKKLQEEENKKGNRKSSSSFGSPPPMPRTSSTSSMSGWNCLQCTFENSSSEQKCTMCGAKKPSPPAYTSSSSSSGTIHVRCPNCKTTLATTASATLFQCMQCQTTSSTLTNRV